MAPDSFTEVSQQGWFSRIGNSIKGILVGLVLIVVSVLLLFWNEGRAVKRYKTLKEGGGAVVSINSGTVNTSNDGRLVHVSGLAETSETLVDPAFEVKSPALKLKRTVLVYQWRENSSSETKKKVGGGTETVTTYSYDKTWSEGLINSSTFKHPEGHTNPSTIPHQSQEVVAQKVTLGSFRLPPSLVARIDNYAGLPVQADHQLPAALGWKARIEGGGLYIGRSSSSPEIGDMKVSFSTVAPTNVSLVAKQVGDTFEAYLTKVGGMIELLQVGTVSADAMFEKAQQENTMLTWILRVVGFLLMFVGLKMLLAPLAVFADVLPIAGTIVGAGIGIVSFLTALAFSFLTVAVAWIFYRPFIGVTLLVLFIVIVVLIVRKLRKVDLPPLPTT